MQACRTRVSYKSAAQGARVLHKRVPQECPSRVSRKTVSSGGVFSLQLVRTVLEGTSQHESQALQVGWAHRVRGPREWTDVLA